MIGRNAEEQISFVNNLLLFASFSLSIHAKKIAE